jgi:hypothetical protein
LAVFRVLEYAGKLTVLVALIVWIADIPERDRAARMVKKVMQHSCNTSITRRGARGSVLGFWAFAGQSFPSGKENVTFPLVVSFGVKMINEVS